MGTENDDGPGHRTLVVGGVVLGLLGLGWFILSHVVMGTATVDAVVEALGVVLALLVVGSVVGAVRDSVRARKEVGGDRPAN